MHFWHFIKCQLVGSLYWKVVRFPRCFWIGRCWMTAMHSSKQLSEIQIYTPKLSEIPTEVQLCPFWENVCMYLCVCDGSVYARVLQHHQRGVLYGLDWIYMFPSVLSLLILEIFTKWINGSQHFLKGKGVVVREQLYTGWTESLLADRNSACVELIIAEKKGLIKNILLWTYIHWLLSHSDIIFIVWRCLQTVNAHCWYSFLV